MPTIPAASDLPAGSIIATHDIAYLRALDGPGAVWRGTDGSRIRDDQVDILLSIDAVAVRVGYDH